jgi:hypothetical protein
MRPLSIWSLITVALLLGGFALPLFDPSPVHAVTRDSGKDDNNGKDKDKQDGNGKKGQGEEKRAGKEEKNKGTKDADINEAQGSAITDSGYRVTVDCIHDDTAGTSTCTFTGVVPDGGKKINHLDIPHDAVCADVIGGEYRLVESDPHTGVTGYRSKGSNDSITLVLDGRVAPGGTITAWIKAASAIMPVSGPGLDCSMGSRLLPQTPAAPTPAATPPPTTGELVVLIYHCSDVPEDRTEYDWFGLCDPEAGVHGLELVPIREFAVEPHLVDSDASGDVTFERLQPGHYSLKLADGIWCKAFSDNVDPEGNVIIETGQRTTVYGFTCEGSPAV